MPSELKSENGRFTLVIQNDGNLVCYDRGEAYWSSDTVRLDEIVPPNTPLPVTLPSLSIQGKFFGCNNQVFTVIQCSDFNLFGRFCHGEDVRPVLKQRASTGFNTIRVFTLYDLAHVNIGVLLDPDYSRITEFLELAASYRMYVEFVAYTSLERKNHWDALKEACQGSTNVLLELVNEGTIQVNYIDMPRYTKPLSTLASHGSGGSEGIPPWEPWDYVTFHTNGSNEEQRKVGHNAMFDIADVYGVPALTNETSRYPDVGMWVGRSLSEQKQLAYDSAAGAALLCAGSCFHSVHGKSSELWDANELAVAQSWVAGALSIPKNAQLEPYRRRDDLLTGRLIRVYQRGTSDANIVRIHQ